MLKKPPAEKSGNGGGGKKPKANWKDYLLLAGMVGGIFCFNAKGKRYAVGNTEVGREEYLRIRKILLDYVVGELEGRGELGLSILSFGGKEKEKKESLGK